MFFTLYYNNDEFDFSYRERCRGCRGGPEHTVTDAFGKVEVFAEGGLERRAAMVELKYLPLLKSLEKYVHST